MDIKHNRAGRKRFYSNCLPLFDLVTQLMVNRIGSIALLLFVEDENKRQELCLMVLPISYFGT